MTGHPDGAFYFALCMPVVSRRGKFEFCRVFDFFVPRTRRRKIGARIICGGTTCYSHGTVITSVTLPSNTPTPANRQYNGVAALFIGTTITTLRETVIYHIEPEQFLPTASFRKTNV